MGQRESKAGHFTTPKLQRDEGAVPHARRPCVEEA